MGACPICNTPCEQHEHVIKCPRCGDFLVDNRGGPARWALNDLSTYLGDWDATSKNKRSRLSHLVRKQQRPYERVPIDVYFLADLHLDDPLPSPAEQMDDLILWIGDYQPSKAEPVRIDKPALAAWLGVELTPQRPEAGLDWLLDQSDHIHLLEKQTLQSPAGLGLRLLMPGWGHYQKLKRGRVESREAFMAMKFGVPELERVYNDCFRPAVARTGFELLYQRP